jgi:predicted DNA-binding protein (MmcQ/YjbR family)
VWPAPKALEWRGAESDDRTRRGRIVEVQAIPQSVLETIRSIASKYPEAEQAFLLGNHEVFRVRKKVFVWLGNGDEGIFVSVKLKETQGAALMLPFVKPAAYGMAKWGWISADFPKKQLPADLVRNWWPGSPGGRSANFFAIRPPEGRGWSRS